MCIETRGMWLRLSDDTPMERKAERQSRLGSFQGRIRCKRFARRCHQESRILLGVRVCLEYGQATRSLRPSCALRAPTHWLLFEFKGPMLKVSGEIVNSVPPNVMDMATSVLQGTNIIICESVQRHSGHVPDDDVLVQVPSLAKAEPGMLL